MAFLDTEEFQTRLIVALGGVERAWNDTKEWQNEALRLLSAIKDSDGGGGTGGGLTADQAQALIDAAVAGYIPAQPTSTTEFNGNIDDTSSDAWKPGVCLDLGSSATGTPPAASIATLTIWTIGPLNVNQGLVQWAMQPYTDAHAVGTADDQGNMQLWFRVSAIYNGVRNLGLWHEILSADRIQYQMGLAAGDGFVWDANQYNLDLDWLLGFGTKQANLAAQLAGNGLEAVEGKLAVTGGGSSTGVTPRVPVVTTGTSQSFTATDANIKGNVFGETVLVLWHTDVAPNARLNINGAGAYPLLPSISGLLGSSPLPQIKSGQVSELVMLVTAGARFWAFKMTPMLPAGANAIPQNPRGLGSFGSVALAEDTFTDDVENGVPIAASLPWVKKQISNAMASLPSGGEANEVTYSTETTLYSASEEVPHVQGTTGDIPLAPMQELVLHAQNDQGYWQTLQQVQNQLKTTQALSTQLQKNMQALSARVAVLENVPAPEPVPVYDMANGTTLHTPALLGLIGINIGGIDLIGSGWTAPSNGLLVLDGGTAIGLLTENWIAVNGVKADPTGTVVLNLLDDGDSADIKLHAGDVITQNGMGNITFYKQISG